MNEYEEIRAKYENEALALHSMSPAAIDASRELIRGLVARFGLTPERVWALTMNMRSLGNGGVL